MALQAVLSVALSVYVSHRLELNDGWWAAISAFAVMQTGVAASFYRGLLRVAGTALGALLGLTLGQIVDGHPALFIILMSAASWAGLYGTLCYRHSYAWVLSVITFVMVMGEALIEPGGLETFAWDRFCNVAIGTLACVLVAGLADPWLRGALRRWATRSSEPAAPYNWSLPPAPNVDRREAAWHALTGALAVAVLSLASDLLALKSFSQAMVTTIALLVVPMTPGATDAASQVLRRMTHRFAGCLIAGLLAGALLPLIGARPWLCQLALAVGVWTGAYLQGGPISVRYMGTQFSVAFIMVFVQDQGWTVEVEPAIERLAGVFAGICVLGLIFSGMTRVRSAVH